MGGRLLARVVAMSTVILASPGWAGGAGGFHGGGLHDGGLRPAGHPGVGGPRGFGGGAWRGGAPPLPSVAGVIHERSGRGPFYAAFGHVNTGYGLVGGGWRSGFGGRVPARFGHVATGFRGGQFRRDRGAWFGGHWHRERLADGRRISTYRYGRGLEGYGGGSFGGEPGFSDGACYEGSEGCGSTGTYGAPGTYGKPGTYGSVGFYGGYGTRPVYSGAYLSELPLAATRAEPPLAPSPYGPDGGYYAPRRSGVAPHILTVDRSSASVCRCEPATSAYPVIYRYGVGTAY